VTQIFLSFFHNSCFFVYRHSDLEGLCLNCNAIRHMNLVAWGCSGSWYLSDSGMYNLKHVWKGTVEYMMGVAGR